GGDQPAAGEEGRLVVRDPLQERQEDLREDPLSREDLDHFLATLFIEPQGEDLLAVTQHLFAAERMSSLQVILKPLVDQSQRLQRNAVIAELSGDVEFDQVVEADRPITVDRRVIAPEYRCAGLLAWPSMEPLPDPLGL